MADQLLQFINDKFGADLKTFVTSIVSGTSSTGIGIYLTKITDLNWQFQTNMVSLAWGLASCIILTLVSLLVTDLYKSIKKKIKGEK